MQCRAPLVPVILAFVMAAACSTPADAPRAPRNDIRLVPDTETIVANVPRGGTLAQVLREHRLPEQLVEAAVRAAAPMFDLRRLRAGNPYRLVRTLDGVLQEFVYRIDADRFLRIVGRERSPEPVLDAQILPYEKVERRVALRGAIDADHPSLIATLDAAGERVELALALADIFGGEVDFNNDIQPGDSFELLFDRYSIDDEAFAGYGPIVAATFNTGGRQLQAYRFTGPGGTAAYYDEQGRSMRRFFLRSPLKFEPRVTSAFSPNRLHPILNSYRAHLGVDYRAPSGAPVVAVAGGVVVSAGYNGGAGRMVTVHHASGYESSYLHLSSISVARGARVEQGQMVGRVGATGLATGPHLDFRLKKNGTYVNPVTEQRKLPPGEPIPSSALDDFFAARRVTLTELAVASSPGTLVHASANAGKIQQTLPTAHW